MILCSALSFSQTRKDKMQSIRIAYITSELSLTPEETSKFLPILIEYDNKQKELRQRMKTIINKRSTIDELSETESL